MSTELLQRAFASTAGVLPNVRSDQLDRPTPCASWTVRDLINHIVCGATLYVVIAETGAPPADPGSPDHTTGNVAAAFDEGARRALKAFSADGAMERTMTLPFGDLPGAVLVQIAAIDTFTHGWDLAKATGQPTDLDASVAAELLERATALIPDGLRGTDGEAAFGAKVAPSPSATAADRLAAFLGRHP